MRTVSAHQLGLDEKPRPLGEINADLEDAKALRRLVDLMAAPALQARAAELKELGYPPVAIVEDMIKQP
jgi:hypothetical protein